MENIFLHLLKMSITAGLLVVVVLLLRVVFCKAPRWIHCLLWALVAVRLLCPITPESSLSLMPDTDAAFSAVTEQLSTPQEEPDTPVVDNAVTDTPVVNTPITNAPTVDTPVVDTPVVDTPVVTPTPNTPPSASVDTPTTNVAVSAPTPEASVDPWQVAVTVASYVWLAGVALLAAYAVFTTLRLRRQVREAARFTDRVWCCDHIRSPFILGVFRPRIYLPSDLDGVARDSVIAHEQAHLHRRDHWWKPLGFLLLTVHWFNPLMWVAYILLCRDIEAACDERVVRDMTAPDRKTYSEVLLACSAPRRLVSACPLAFGETSVKSRVKSVLSYKKPTIWIIVAALLVSTVAGVCLLTDPKDKPAKEPDSKTDVTNQPNEGDKGEQSTAPKYASFVHTGEPKAKVQLELDGNGCTYTNSILSSWMAASGTYEVKGDSIILSFPDDAMTIEFEGDFTGLKLRMGQSDTRMSYDQMSFGGYELKNGAVFARQMDNRAVPYTAETFYSRNWLSEALQQEMREKYQYRTGNYSDKDWPIIPITSRSELDAFFATYENEVSDFGFATADVSAYDDAFFAEKMLLAVYYRNGSSSVKPEIAAVEYTGAELVTVQVDVYEPSIRNAMLGQWFMLAEVPLDEIPYATAYRAVERDHIPTDYYWATYSHPVAVDEDDVAIGYYSIFEYGRKTLIPLVEGLEWYAPEGGVDTDFTAIAYFAFDGEKQYYVSHDKKQLYDGEHFANLTAEQSEQLDFYLRDGNPGEDAIAASVTGTVTQWSKEGDYIILEVTEGDSKLGPRVMAYTTILMPGSAPAVGYSATIYYDGWYQPGDDYSVIYALDRKWMDADLLGGPDEPDEPDEPTTTTPPTTSTTPPTSSSTTTQPTEPTIPTVSDPAVGETFVTGGFGVWADTVLEEVYGGQSVCVFDSYEEWDTFLNTYATDDRYLKREDLAQFNADWFADNSLLMTYYTYYTCSAEPKVAAYTYTDGGVGLAVAVDVYIPYMCNDAVGGWHLFSGVQKTALQGVTKLTVYSRAVIPTQYYVAVYADPTEFPSAAVESWREFLPADEGWDLEMQMKEWENTDRWIDSFSVNRAFSFVAVIRMDGHLHYVSDDYSALVRDDGTLVWLTAEEAELIQKAISVADDYRED